MKAVLRIAADEWRFWIRSRLAVAGLAVFALLLIGTAASTVSRVHDERSRRLEQQAQADERFAAQPARHPHRMVHYGHYVFRPPAPLAILDPGVDALTGEALFLEGHRQNSATFADAAANVNAGVFTTLTPATMYQIFLPLLLIAFGHGLILRERESGTLAKLLALGLSGTTLVTGKALALVALVGVLLLPAISIVAIALINGEALLIGTSIVLTYAAYLLIWSFIITWVSLACRERGWALGVLLTVWLAWTLMVPRAGVAYTLARQPALGKVEMDLRMQADLRKLGDGHNAGDPQFTQLRDNLLNQYGVDHVEDLPVNIRGIVAGRAEASTTNVLNRYANDLMAREAQQVQSMSGWGWLSPTIAVSAASRTLAGTDLATHHRFLREGEALRFDFVQGLNRIHANKLAYSDDIARSRNVEAERRTRVSAENWSLLKAFQFERAAPTDRVRSASTAWLMLVVWAMALILTCGLSATRLTP